VLSQPGPALYAVHKPAGWRVHPADPDGTDDLVTWLARQPTLPPGTAPVHRVDADASGLVLCAGSPEARRTASAWFAGTELQKVYLALVHGRTHKKGVIHRPLQDGRRGRPLTATTRYKRLEWIGAFTLLAVSIETGRKHQIRRHLQSIGHALVGDTRYPPPRFRPVPGFLPRLWLHARALVLPDGTSIEDPLPDELLKQLELLRAGARQGPPGEDDGDDADVDDIDDLDGQLLGGDRDGVGPDEGGEE
jgi:23S rRNA-/tRNA-specific pseudouridylate synthase